MRGTVFRVAALVVTIAAFFAVERYFAVGLGSPAQWITRTVLFVALAAALGSWSRTVGFEGTKPNSIAISDKNGSRDIDMAEIAIVIPDGGTKRSAGAFIILRPWWRLPHLRIFVPRSEFKVWAAADVRVLYYGRRRLERQRRIQERADDFFSQGS